MNTSLGLTGIVVVCIFAGLYSWSALDAQSIEPNDISQTTKTHALHKNNIPEEQLSELENIHTDTYTSQKEYVTQNLEQDVPSINQTSSGHMYQQREVLLKDSKKRLQMETMTQSISCEGNETKHKSDTIQTENGTYSYEMQCSSSVNTQK